MARQAGILIDSLKFTIVRDIVYDDTRVGGMYVKAEGELYPAAYIYPKSNQLEIENVLRDCREAKAHYDKIVAAAYYSLLPKLREVKKDV